MAPKTMTDLWAIFLSTKRRLFLANLESELPLPGNTVPYLTKRYEYTEWNDKSSATKNIHTWRSSSPNYFCIHYQTWLSTIFRSPHTTTHVTFHILVILSFSLNMHDCIKTLELWLVTNRIMVSTPNSNFIQFIAWARAILYATSRHSNILPQHCYRIMIKHHADSIKTKGETCLTILRTPTHSPFGYSKVGVTQV